MRKRTILGSIITLALASGCSTMEGMMHGGGGQHVTLSGSNEVPAVMTSASGSGTVTVGADCSVKADITVSGM